MINHKSGANMYSKGFSKLFIAIMLAIGLVILIPIALVASHEASVNNRKRQIQDQIDALHIAATPESTQCDGDGVDSAPWCDYRYTGSATIVEKALLAAGYAEDTSNKLPGSTEHRYVGGNPKIAFRVSASDGVTTLYGEWSQ